MVIFYSYVKLLEGTQLKPWRMNIEWTICFFGYRHLTPNHPKWFHARTPVPKMAVGSRIHFFNSWEKILLLLQIGADANRIYRSKWEIACKYEAFEKSSTWWAMPTRCQSLPWSPKKQILQCILLILQCICLVGEDTILYIMIYTMLHI